MSVADPPVVVERVSVNPLELVNAKRPIVILVTASESVKLLLVTVGTV